VLVGLCAAPGVAAQPDVLEKTPLERANEQGFAFHPSAPERGAFRFAVGAFYDAIDPQVMFGYNLRVPQLALDARYALGQGWSLTGHFNSLFVTNELLLGASYAQRSGPWSFAVQASAGVYLGKLEQFGFDAAFLAGEYRPEIALGYQIGRLAVTLRANLLLLGPERAFVGGVSGGFDNARLFTGHSETLIVENATESGSLWYYGVGLLTTRSYYAFWLLFPDSPGLFTYPRLVAGYEF
jgi:hypothetical protein